MAYLKMMFQTSRLVGYVMLIPYRGYVPAVNLPGGVRLNPRWGPYLTRGRAQKNPPPRWIDAPSTSRLEGVWRVRMPKEIRGNVRCGAGVGDTKSGCGS